MILGVGFKRNAYLCLGKGQMRPFQHGIMTSATSQVAPLFHLFDLKKRLNGFSI